MNCLINFLSDNNQKNIINMIQNRDETFEKELDSYKKLFKVQLRYCLSEDENYCYNDDCICRDACRSIRTIIVNEISFDEIEEFYDKIRNCYLDWINANIPKALEDFEIMLKKYNIIDNDADGTDSEREKLLLRDIENRIFFRARMSDDYLCKKEIFHIPFNKRYNILNERFSLTGQPLLYLGNSIADLSEELGFGINDDSISRLRVSSFEFKNGKKPKKIFDLRCSLRHDLIIPSEFKKQAFFRNILSEICSFQKRKEIEESAFKEEYVIPQMLSIILKKNKYDGICYYSTKKFIGYVLQGVGVDISECDKNMQYRENIVLFTNQKAPKEQRNISNTEDSSGNDYSFTYASNRIYDDDLFNSMDISIPIAINNVKFCSEQDLYKLEQMISTRYDSIKVSTEKDNQKMLNIAKRNKEKATAVMSFFRKVFYNLCIDGTRYNETKAGRIHIQLLVGILNRLLVESALPDENDFFKDTTE